MAAIYACGYSAPEMKDIISKSYKNLATFEKKRMAKAGFNYLTTKHMKIEGFVDGIKVEKLVESFAAPQKVVKMSECKIPLATVTCDTKSMKEVVCVSKKAKFTEKDKIYINDMDLKTAVRASMSFPGIYTTCNYKDLNLIDGGTKNNLSVQVLKDFGADKIITISFDLDSYIPTGELSDVVVRALDIFSLENVLKGREASDVSVIIKTDGTSLLEISNIEEVFKAGYNSVMEHKKELLKLK